ncbi:hypothetical protein San01_02630 [Streptomyces angustmyceticus]|uniref:Uncharacterized protein n=1 Tax=Streptomyces angustmyceticus TaxID=285578 RepID=A0A5J4L8Z3_9ACTN|nr:hypothetical protein San01_02630 [Streptomyces angustmyceticus]
MPGQPVGYRAAEQQEEDQRDRPRGRHQADVGGGAAGCEHREGGGDHRAGAAEVRDDRGAGEQQVVAPRPWGAGRNYQEDTGTKGAAANGFRPGAPAARCTGCAGARTPPSSLCCCPGRMDVNDRHGDPWAAPG